MRASIKKGLSNWRYLVLMPILLAGVLSIIASGGGGDDPVDDGGTTAGKVTITGSVTGSGGIPGVTVSAEGIEGASDDNGFYLLEAVPVPLDGQLVLTYEKDGYATYQRSVPVVDGETYSVAASLMLFHYSEVKDATVEQDLNILDPDNPDPDNPLAEIVFPANSMADSGSVTINIGVGDPTTTEGAAVFPGDYMAATTEDGDADTPLESIAFTEITIIDDQGNEITTLSEPATLTVRLPDSLQSKYGAGDSIEWWSYDETNASWIREDADPSTPDTIDDAAVIDLRGDGVLYAQAKVTHMSWWNVDEPIDQHSCLCTTIVDKEGSPLVNQLLTAEGVTYTGVSLPAATDNQGYACVTVKRSTDTVTERINLYVDFGGLRFHYDVTDPTEGDEVNDEVFTPTLEGSTVYNTGECVTLANNITAAFNGEINGTVIYEGIGTPASDFTLYSSYGETATTNVDGQYVMSAPVGVSVSLYAVGLVSQTVTVIDAATPVTINFEIPNQTPVIESLTRVPEGTVANDATIALTVTASDPDGDSISYAWSADVGSFDQTNSAMVTWTAPASGSGTATVTITVTDDKGAQASQSISIVYGETLTGGTSLSFIIKDNLKSDLPLSGVTVALYNTDNVTIETTQVSDVNGVVDFGDVGRERVTFTIAHEYDQIISTFAYTLRNIQSFVEVLAAEGVVYYAEYASILGNELGQINITLDQDLVPVDASFTLIHPIFAYWSHELSTGLLTNIPVYDSHLQDDGNLTLLALTKDSADSLLKWDMLENQLFTDGATYDIGLTRDPVGLGWTTTPNTVLSNLSITANRQGVDYFISNTQSASASGSLPFPTGFPVDEYLVFGEADVSAEMLLSSYKSYATLPQTVEVPIPDYSFDAVNFDTTSGILSWTLLGTSSRDLINIDAIGTTVDLDSTVIVDWDIEMSPESTSWQVMDLPSPANTWLDTSSLETSLSNVDLEVIDWDFVSGFDEVWNFFITGGDLFASAGVVLIGEYEFINFQFKDATTDSTTTALKTVSPDASVIPQQLESTSITDRLSRGFSGLRRR